MPHNSEHEHNWVTSRNLDDSLVPPNLIRNTDQGHYSLVREDDDDAEAYDDNLHTYDAERLVFKRYQPMEAPLPPLSPPKTASTRTTAASTVLCPGPRRQMRS